MHFLNKNFPSILFYTFCLFFTPTTSTSACCSAQAAWAWGALAGGSKGDGAGKATGGRMLLVPRLEATPAATAGLIGSGICREM